MAKVWASNLLGLMYNDLGQPEEARAVLVEYTAVARSAHEPQTTVPHLGQLTRCAQSESQMAELVKEILSLTDTTAYPRYEILPALRQACSWLAETSRGILLHCFGWKRLISKCKTGNRLPPWMKSVRKLQGYEVTGDKPFPPMNQQLYTGKL
jgi:hypothetical protein